MADNVSRLPSAMQSKKDELVKDSAPPQDPPKTDPPASSEVPPPKDGDRVTISREEFNELQAARDKVTSVEGRHAALLDDLEAVQARLTELEGAAKGSRQADPPASPAPAPSAAQVELPVVEITAKEREDFEEDSIALMTKLANNVFSERAKPLLDKINEVLGKLGDVEKVSNTAVATTRNISRQNYTETVASKVAEFSDFNAIVSHKHWKDFTDGVEPLSGDTYATLIAKNVENSNVDGMVNIFRRFYEKYMKDEAKKPDGYASALPTGDREVEAPAGGGEKLKLSDRQALHKRYISKEITYDQFQELKKPFDIADKEGRLDYEA